MLKVTPAGKAPLRSNQTLQFAWDPAVSPSPPHLWAGDSPAQVSSVKGLLTAEGFLLEAPRGLRPSLLNQLQGQSLKAIHSGHKQEPRGQGSGAEQKMPGYRVR